MSVLYFYPKDYNINVPAILMTVRETDRQIHFKKHNSLSISGKEISAHFLIMNLSCCIYVSYKYL